MLTALWISPCVLAAPAVPSAPPPAELLEFLGEWQDPSGEVLVPDMFEFERAGETPDPVPATAEDAKHE